jgi:hypothetical protein
MTTPMERVGIIEPGAQAKPGVLVSIYLPARLQARLAQQEGELFNQLSYIAYILR